MTDPLRIGPIVLETPVVLAPMAGVTNASFRRLCRRYGGGLFVSEMLQATTVVEGNPRAMRLAAFAPDEPLRSVQLAAATPALARAAVERLVGEIGVDHIDLNMGCPVPKVTRKGGGAALAARPERLAAVVGAAVAAAGPVPVTVKMRLGLDAEHIGFLEAGRVARAEGAAAVALHARTAAQLYAGPADWSAIAALVAALPSLPVLGNGDVWTAADALELMRVTGCAGVVVGRGCLGRPWLFGDLVRVLAGQAPAAPPRLGQVIEVMGEHVEMLIGELGERAALRSFRKHIGWYCTGYDVGADFGAAAVRVETSAELVALLARLDPSVEVDPDALTRPRGTTRGPQSMSLPAGWLTG